MAGLRGGLWEDELLPAQSSALAACCRGFKGTIVLQERHSAGRVPAINTNLVKYRQNLKARGSGQLPVDDQVRRWGCCCLWPSCGLGRKMPPVVISVWREGRGLAWWGSEIWGWKEECSELSDAGRFEEGHARRNEAFATPSVLPTQCLVSSQCSGYKQGAGLFLGDFLFKADPSWTS